MKIDLSPYFDKEIAIVINAFLKYRDIWKQKDIAYLGHKDKWPTITFIPEILYYEEKGINVAVPWLGLKITTQYELEDAMRIVLDTLSFIGLKPFKDEDAFKYHFSKPKSFENLISVKCYVNLHYQEGYWYNHVL